MNTSELKLYTSADKNHNRATISEIKLSQAEPNLVKPQPITKPDSTLFLLPLCFLIIWAGIVSIASGVWKVTRNEKVAVKHLDQQIPCKNCQFFTSSHYLKCAVHPSIALTQQAVGCSDYCPKITE